MRNSKQPLILVALVCFLVSFSTCRKDVLYLKDLTELPDLKAHEIIDKYVRDLELLPQTDEKLEQLSNKDSVVNELTTCNVQVYRGIDHKESILLPNFNTPVFPGEVYDLNSIVSGEYKMIPEGRQNAPLNLEFNFYNSIIYEETKYDLNLGNKISNTLKRTNRNLKSPGFTIELIEAFSPNQIFSELGIGEKSMIKNFIGNLNFSNPSFDNRFIALIKVDDFSVGVEDPQRPSQWFPQLKNLGVFGKYSPVYVKNLQYGKLLLLLIESNFSREDVFNKLQDSFIGSLSGQTFDSNKTYQQLAASSQIRAMMVGGLENELVTFSDGTPSQIASYLKALSLDKNGSLAVPISFKSSYLKDGTVFKFASEIKPYQIKRCVTVGTIGRTISKPLFFNYLIKPGIDQGEDPYLGRSPYRVDLEASLSIREERELWVSFNVLVRDSNGANAFGDTEATHEGEILLDDFSIPTDERLLWITTPAKINVSFWVPGIENTSWSTLPKVLPGSPVTITPAMFLDGTSLQPDGFIRQIVANSAHQWADFPSDGSINKHFIKIYFNDIRVETRKK